MDRCKFCQEEKEYISKIIGVCRECILNGDWEGIREHLMAVHVMLRNAEGLPSNPPKAAKSECKFQCHFCINECRIGGQNTSYCGLRSISNDKEGTLPFPSESKAYIHGYLDSNPTNCCNAWFCPAGTSNGYPVYSNSNGPEFGTYSYAAFLYGCSFDCLFCQNSQHKHFSKNNLVTADNIAEQIVNNEDITCICFFGGTPEPQLPFTLHLSEIILERIEEQENRPFRVCWEWNGSGNQKLAEKCMKIALKTGGNIKFDLKTFYKKLNYALCGVSNRRTLENFKYLAERYFGTREDNMPELSGCTLLVPKYTTAKDVEKIAQFISSIDNNIPYSLLIFHPDYQMKDLPVTPKRQALQCLKVAQKHLSNVNLGNRFLLGL